MSKSQKEKQPFHAKERSSRSRAPNWTDALDTIMLALMRQENDEGNCCNGTFSQETWRKMTSMFNARTNKTFSYSNLKNRLKVLKKTFNLYYNLANRSGWGWDPVLKLPTCGDEHMWDEVISVNKDYARIKGKSFPTYDDIDILFSKNIATGRRGDTSALPEGVSDDDTSDDDGSRINLDDMGIGQPSEQRGGALGSSSSPLDHLFDDVSPSSPTTCASTRPIEPSLDAGLSTSSGKRKFQASTASTARRTRPATDATNVLIDLVDQGRKRLDIANEILRRDRLARPTVYSIDECMRKLESLPGITPECILAVGETLKNETNRWFLMHYEGTLLQAWLNRQMAEFYRVPPSMAAPSGSYASMPHVFMPMHGVHRGGPPVFVPPMNIPTPGGPIPSMQPLFRRSSEDSTLSPDGSSEQFISTTSATSSHDFESGGHRWP